MMGGILGGGSGGGGGGWDAYNRRQKQLADAEQLRRQAEALHAANAWLRAMGVRTLYTEPADYRDTPSPEPSSGMDADC